MKKVLVSVVTLLSVVQITAQIKLPRLISNGMVLQRDIPLKLWGWAAAHENITVSFLGKQYNTTADAGGNWQVQISKQKAGGPYTMQLKASNSITIENILIGDVWICGGQSNMELWMDRLRYRYANEVATANNPNIRQFLVPDKYNFTEPQKDIEAGTWQSVTTKTIGEFSGVAYFFAKEINAKYNIPVGLINTALGGSPAEAWISEEAVTKFPAYYDELKKFKDNNLIKQIESRDQQVSNTWYNYINEFDQGHKKNWQLPDTDDKGWKEMNIPGYWADAGEGNVNGVVWFRKEIEVPAAMVNQPALLELGRVVDADSVFVNGRFVGWTSYQYPPRRYELPAGVLKEGKNSIVVRVVSNGGKGGFVMDKKYEIRTAAGKISLSGTWKYKTGVTAVPLPGQTFIRWKPVGLYNAMIAPLTNYAIKGAIWYQGEANTKNPPEYKELMQTLIENWRAKWGQGNFPFYYVQLANFMEAKAEPQESSWAALRQQQLQTLSVPNTGMAVAIDLGDWNDIHPEDKETVGYRLALLARKNVYGEKKLVDAGPKYESMKVVGNKIILSFSNTAGGLRILNGGDLRQFAIAGADKKYVWANAVIRGNTVEVWHDAIANPVAVRYAWADNPDDANLYNREGLPASPFTTDN